MQEKKTTDRRWSKTIKRCAKNSRKTTSTSLCFSSTFFRPFKSNIRSYARSAFLEEERMIWFEYDVNIRAIHKYRDDRPIYAFSYYSALLSHLTYSSNYRARHLLIATSRRWCWFRRTLWYFVSSALRCNSIRRMWRLRSASSFWKFKYRICNRKSKSSSKYKRYLFKIIFISLSLLFSLWIF